MARDGTETRENIMDAAEELVLQDGFSASSVEAIVDRAGVTKGAFFHHFPAKTDLAQSLVERYAERDARMLEEYMEKAERLHRDPLQQILLFVGLFEDAMREIDSPEVGCLFASYCYESGLFEPETHAVITDAMTAWRTRIAEKLAEVEAEHPARAEVDRESLADLLTVIFEGALVFTRTMEEPAAVARQLRHYRTYLELLYGGSGPT